MFSVINAGLSVPAYGGRGSRTIVKGGDSLAGLLGVVFRGSERSVQAFGTHVRDRPPKHWFKVNYFLKRRGVRKWGHGQEGLTKGARTSLLEGWLETVAQSGLLGEAVAGLLAAAPELVSTTVPA